MAVNSASTRTEKYSTATKGSGYGSKGIRCSFVGDGNEMVLT